jgi:hypothetical protein
MLFFLVECCFFLLLFLVSCCFFHSQEWSYYPNFATDFVPTFVSLEWLRLDVKLTVKLTRVFCLSSFHFQFAFHQSFDPSRLRDTNSCPVRNRPYLVLPHHCPHRVVLWFHICYLIVSYRIVSWYSYRFILSLVYLSHID